MPASGTDLPPELLNRILDFIAPSTRTERPPIPFNNRQLGLCSLTCRFWRRCQQFIFRRVWLRTHQDVLDIASFLDSPHSHIRDYIDVLDVSQRALCEPWIHLVHIILSPKLKPGSNPQRELALSGFHSPASYRTFRSIYATLPRPLPHAFCRFRIVRLLNVHFRSYKDFMCLVAEIPELEQLTCASLQWDLEPQVPPFHRPAPRLHVVTFSACTTTWSAIWLMVGPKRSSLPSPDGCQALSRDESSTIGALTRSVEAAVTANQSWHRGQQGYTGRLALRHGTDHVGKSTSCSLDQ